MIGAVIMCVAYIALVIVLITGFEKSHDMTGDIVFAVVNAAVGLIIMQFLKIQGTSFAKNLKENKEILKQYYNTKTKDKKLRNINYFWTTSVIKDVLFKGLTLGASTIGIIYIVMKGSHDYALLLLAVVNLIMFICFGILSLNKAYEFFNNRHIPYIKEKLREMEEKKKENKNDILQGNTQSRPRRRRPNRVQQKKKFNSRRPNQEHKRPINTAS